MRLVKLSTAAAVAAGLATSASAVELTEAIKGVDVSGYVRYRMEMFGGDEGANTATDPAQDTLGTGEEDVKTRHRYKYRVKFTAPVNDDVNTVLTFGNVNDSGNDQNSDGETYVSNETYGNAGFGLVHAYFQYTGVENLVVNAGKQPMPTPFNEDEHGTGLVAMYNAGPVTVAGGAFDNTNTENGANLDLRGVRDSGSAGKNVYALGVIGSVDMVNASFWYATHQHGFDAWTLAADANVIDSDDMTVNVGGRYSVLEIDDVLQDQANLNEDNGLWKLHANAEMGNFFAGVSYAQTDDDGGIVGYDTDAAVSYQLENLSMYKKADADAYKIGAGATFGKLTASLDYMDMEYDGNTDADELLPAVAYQMSDNFNIKLFHSMIEDDNEDSDETQLELRYDF